MSGSTTLATFVARERQAGGSDDVGALLLRLAGALREISSVLARGALAGAPGEPIGDNPQGERQTRMDVIANDVMLRACLSSGHVAALASEEMEAPYPMSGGDLLLAIDPLDGSSNLDVNVSVGTIFSVRRRPGGGGAPGVDDFLQPGARQLCAGYALYGSATMLVLTTGRGVHGFTLHRGDDEFVLTHPDMRIPEETREFAINASNGRLWEPPVRRYVDECVAGHSGARGVDFNMRWVGSMVADVHRVLVRGGVFMHPRDTRDPARPGKLRLLYEAAPMAMLVEQAGGLASTGRDPLLDVVPRALHERVPVILGSCREVERLVGYHAEHDRGLDRPYTSPLFNVRSVLRGT